MNDWESQAATLHDHGLSTAEVARAVGKNYMTVWNALNREHSREVNRDQYRRCVRGAGKMLATTKLPEHTVNDLDRIAKERGLSRRKLIAEVLSDFVETETF